MGSFKRIGVARVLAAVLLFAFAAFVLLSFSKEAFDAKALLFMALVMLLILVQHMLLAWLLPHGDRLMAMLVSFLMTVGLVIQYRLNSSNALNQLVFSCIGIVAMLIMLVLMKKPVVMLYLRIPAAIASVGILLALLFIGKEYGGAVNWISIAGIMFQPSEFVKVAMILILAGSMSEKTEVKKLIMPTLFAVTVAALLVIQRDLGAAMLMAMVYLTMFYASTGKLGTTLLGAAACGAGATASYFIFDHVRRRVAVWQDPWATYSTSGFQIAQGLMAIASGGLWGMGLGEGSPKLIPAYQTDYIFAVICEEFGIVFGIGIMAIYLLIVIRGCMTALNSNNRFVSLCAFGASALIAVQAFIIIGGVIKLIPLTGITMPYVSYGGSSLIACMMLHGILQSAADYNGRMLERELYDEQYGADNGYDEYDDEAGDDGAYEYSGEGEA
ncbi:MAG: FtsW/RodA/SpoVE family cell cycle protein [Eubacteriales bacterium]|nr:FtsW/RodA/SpoVE family cell cycle protein [Eubacteriales bacterium]MCI6979307.1 FtsW/RodA/SpoVE family cell cycle protein [Clostridiales bacterium]MDY5693402.1 FtsW/RodA/SpoVE family cell cycle protein [Eubacteriales bacterium]HZK46065.1 FtsW/RodA/SpoVE family cell cycle protein [Clostridia bacterium]